MSFPARYSGACASCGDRIHEGDQIEMSDAGAVHATCPDPLEVTDRNPLCTVCWLVHPIGACDR